MITPDILQNRIKNFWGYGSLDAKVWFIGMEEGLGDVTETELEDLMLACDGKSMVDLRQDLSHLPKFMRWFQEPFPVQPTWRYPIALYLYLKNRRIPSQQEIREHQGLIFGDSAIKESAAIELMPLPSKKADESTWLYREYGLQGLSSRKEYLTTYKPKRIQELKHLIEKHAPVLVIFYSLRYLNDGTWAEIIGKTPNGITRQMYFTKTDKTSFCVIPQSVSFGMSYNRIYEFAEKLNTEYGEVFSVNK